MFSAWIASLNSPLNCAAFSVVSVFNLDETASHSLGPKVGNSSNTTNNLPKKQLLKLDVNGSVPDNNKNSLPST